MSPLLFNKCVDKIGKQLNKETIGCMIGNVLLNHLYYADDLVLFAPSHKSLQRLTDICSELGLEFDIKTSESKTK